MRAAWALILPQAAGPCRAPDPDTPPTEAETADGQKLRLSPNGRWEDADPAKAAAAQKVAAEYPENKTRPVEAQGGLFGGFGRTIMPGDKDYNRGSLNPKTR